MKTPPQKEGVYNIGIISPNKEMIINFLDKIYNCNIDKPEIWEKEIFSFFSKNLIVPYATIIYKESFKEEEKIFFEDMKKFFLGNLIKPTCTIIWDSNECYKSLIKIRDSLKTGTKIWNYADFFFKTNFIIRRMYIKRDDENDTRFKEYGLAIHPFCYRIKTDDINLYENTYFFLPDKYLDYPLEKWRKEISQNIINKFKKIKKECNHKKRNPIESRLRHEVFKRDDYKCKECGKTKKESVLHCDHIIPVSQGGTDELDNLQTLCAECNLAKSDKCFHGGKKTP